LNGFVAFLAPLILCLSAMNMSKTHALIYSPARAFRYTPVEEENEMLVRGTVRPLPSSLEKYRHHIIVGMLAIFTTIWVCTIIVNIIIGKVAGGT
jgi:hypothetical protein